MSEPGRSRHHHQSAAAAGTAEHRPIMHHEALALFWTLYVLFRFIELTVDEPMKGLEYYTQ